jgi:hypothetical protein
MSAALWAGWALLPAFEAVTGALVTALDLGGSSALAFTRGGLAFRHRGAHRHRAARARHGEFGDFADPQQRQPELQVGGVAYRCPIEFRHQVARLEPGTLGRRLRVDLEDDCSGRPNPFWTLVSRLRPSHPQPRPAAPS